MMMLYGIRHMVKDHSDSKRGNPLLSHGLPFPISSKGYFICTYHSLCYTSHGGLDGMENSSMGPPWRTNLITHHTMSECSYHGATFCSCLEEGRKEMFYLTMHPSHEGSIWWPITLWADALSRSYILYIYILFLKNV